MTTTSAGAGLAVDHRDPELRLRAFFDRGTLRSSGPVSVPEDTRRRIAEALAAAPAGRGAHGNIPL